MRSLLFLFLGIATAVAQDASHPPLRPLEHPSDRPLSDGPRYFVSPTGVDANNGSEAAPWRKISHALTKLRPGDTLYLRGGTYRENLRIALSGPITICGYPGEHAIIDGGIAEFFETPGQAWEPIGGSAGEFRSKSSFANLRNVLGSFGDSMIGLQTYYHAMDLRAANETFDWEDWERRDETDLKPVYLGPGLWYNRETGHIHIRLAKTNLPAPVPNYVGPGDPRELPLILAPFRSIPLMLDGARQVRIHDVTIRGAGYSAVELDQAVDIEFDNVTIWAGAYGIRATGTRILRLLHCGIYGNTAPWTFRGDGSKRDYPGRPHRNLSRLNTHASIEINSGAESSVYAFPQNDDWEIGYCEFTDAHDGPYLGAINARFHHNLIENMQDDGIYLSPMYKRHRLEDKDPQIYIEQNLFRQILTPLAFGGPWPETHDQIFIYRNIVDLRKPVQTGRPSAQNAEPRFSTGKFMGDHGSPPWPAMNIYHNTVLTGDPQRRAAGSAFGGLRAGNPRRVYNNIFYHNARTAAIVAPKPEDDFRSDGNLYWTPDPAAPDAAKFFGKFRNLLPTSEVRSILADPLLKEFRLQPDSPAIRAGIAIPNDWPDPFRADAPDIGAIPANADEFAVGRRGRIRL